MERTVCPVCNAKASKEVYANKSNGVVSTVDYDFSINTRLIFKIVGCLHCQHNYVNILPDLNGLSEDNEDLVYFARKIVKEFQSQI